MHGTPGSRSGPRPRTIVLHRLGVRLISYDRPGYGESSRQQARAVFHAAEDVLRIAEHLGLDRFAIVGRSGGGPHAMACAAHEELAARITKLAVLVSLAPATADGLDWYEGMNDLNRAEYSSIDRDESGALSTLIKQTLEIQRDPESLLRTLDPQLADADRRVVEDMGIRRLLTETYSEALRCNEDGWLDDVLAFRRHWGFEPAEISSAIPTLLWHGADDGFSPVRHTIWLSRQIPHAESWVQRGAAHFTAVEVLPSILAWVTAPKDVRFTADPALAR
ncbi:alpha/beta fold hydrolase [Spirillospora sp. CA-294931]|uniref:alpha/beta fold hydrolase n=1 Tax=Spirillospora sp. CA-294931 TaxID=3240042 RepID=UPI003D93C3AB